MQIFKARNIDLDVTSESWRKASYKEMEERIPKTVRLPRKAIREVIVPIKKDNTLEDLMRINAELLKIYKIDCFQCTIDRKEGKAHLLFDYLDKETGLSYVFNSSDQKMIYAMIMMMLKYSSDREDVGKRYFLLNYYKKDQDIYRKLLDDIQHKDFSKNNYCVLKDILEYVENVCEGKVK